MNETPQTPPHDRDAEAAILARVILDPTALGTIPQLRAEHFYLGLHARVFEAVLALQRAGEAIDTVQVAGWLRARDRLPELGGAAGLQRARSQEDDERFHGRHHEPERSSR